MNGLAQAGNGAAEFVKEGERMQPKVAISLCKLGCPSNKSMGLSFMHEVMFTQAM